MYNYIEKYGNTTFNIKEFNEVDNTIFSLLSYVNYSGIVSNSDNIKKTLNEVATSFFEVHDENYVENSLPVVRNGINLLKRIMNEERYKNVLLYNFVCIENLNEQFAAITYEISKDLLFIGFAGTNDLVSASEEDCKLAYMYPVYAHTDAIKYINYKLKSTKANIILGGHSKGGNLALVAAMEASFFIKRKIIRVYSNDGPGLREKEYKSIKYKKIKDRIIHIIPNYSMVGLLLYSDNNHIVIKSDKVGLSSHNMLSWEVKDDIFLRSDLSNFSKIFDDGIKRWLNKYNDIDLEECTKYIFDIARNNKLYSFNEIKDRKIIVFKLAKDATNINPKVIQMFKELASVFAECNKEYLTFKIENK